MAEDNTKRDYGAWWVSRKKLERADKVADILSSLGQVLSQDGKGLDEEVRDKLLTERRELIKNLHLDRKR